MGAKKKGGKKKGGGGKDILKKLAETPQELLVKESLNEQIVIDKLTIRLD